jgi:hypothetical protein
MGQRPYQVAPAADETYRADDQWVGTGITSEESVESKNAKIKANDNVRQLRLHSLGKRAYIETPTVD